MCLPQINSYQFPAIPNVSNPPDILHPAYLADIYEHLPDRLLSLNLEVLNLLSVSD
jgi:hypothetical protein